MENQVVLPSVVIFLILANIFLHQNYICFKTFNIRVRYHVYIRDTLVHVIRDRKRIKVGSKVQGDYASKSKVEFLKNDILYRT